VSFNAAPQETLRSLFNNSNPNYIQEVRPLCTRWLGTHHFGEFRLKVATTAGQGRQVGIARLDQGLVLGQLVERLVRQVQRVLDYLTRRKGKPLGQTDICELGRLEHLKEDDVFSTRVLNIVRVGRLNVADVARYIPWLVICT
jgi:hypothetical protein